tara:strand:+ start:69 stop:458 length:390 start_codon:yes stop_codon:yes gene_type:complete
MSECGVLKQVLMNNNIHLLNEWVYYNCTCDTCFHKNKEIIISQDIYKKSLESKYKAIVAKEDVIMKVKINESMKEKMLSYKMKNSILGILMDTEFSEIKSNYWILHAIDYVNTKYQGTVKNTSENVQYI